MQTPQITSIPSCEGCNSEEQQTEGAHAQLAPTLERNVQVTEENGPQKIAPAAAAAAKNLRAQNTGP